ncbi:MULTISPECIES: flavodoxin family protein [Clostridium]|nr:flavodoxin family protein [Clostridium perfringens]MBP2860048.1 flavodoxin family protein [Clostridium perfringens]MDG6876848.1 Iron-sulfur flavoprotein [Clostridium perfringens]MDG6886552.1 Iron-sulfur flavoprotein [Clostridium perfringens]MDH5060630.1 Iron-sulfur flavoprotein [Clostridium perfringens NCTC 8239]MDH5077963.1 Iron-sulfur flavoprotein [Clostridium perfringens]
MYKIFAYVGSYRGNNSYSIQLTKELVKNLNDLLNLDIEFKLYTPDNLKINDCVGCASCFLSGKCSRNDEFEEVKNEILESDIIIFSSPVYFHQVSGAMKTFIDRISYWAHTLELRGKIGVSINVSDTNGNKFVEEYLDKVMSTLGMVVLKNISIQTSNIGNKVAFSSIIRVLSNQIVNSINNKDFHISSIQEIYFQNMKVSMNNKSNDEYEKIYWKKNKLFEYDTFSDLFNDSCKINSNEVLCRLNN